VLKDDKENSNQPEYISEKSGYLEDPHNKLGLVIKDKGLIHFYGFPKFVFVKDRRI
jgi:hypothetical protein